MCCAALSFQPCLTLRPPWTADRQAPLSMGILQARILEWVAMTSSRGLPHPGIKPRSPELQTDSLLSEPPGKSKNIGVYPTSIPFLSFIEPIFVWNVPLESLIFLKRSLVFPILFLASVSLCWLLRKAFLSLLAILWNSAFKWEYLSFSTLFLLLLFSQLFARPPQTAILFFCISFSWGWSWSLFPVQCHEPPSIVH